MDRLTALLTDHKLPVGQTARLGFDWLKAHAGPLFDAAAALQVEVPFFFEGLTPGATLDGVAEPAGPAFEALTLTPEDVELLTAFRSITSKRMRRHVLGLVRELARDEAAEVGASET